MAIYYVSPYGSDSNNGLGPDPTAAVNKPFLTLAKAIGASGAATAGDTVYIAPGVYRANTAVGVQGSSGSPITVSGDPANAQGFKDSSGALLAAGEVRLTSWTTNDTTAPTSAQLLNFNNKSYFNFVNLWFLGTTPTISQGSVTLLGGTRDVSFTSCAFTHGSLVSSGGSCLYISSNTAQLAVNVTVDRCLFHSSGADLVTCNLVQNTSADYSANITIRNSLFLGGGNQVRLQSSGSGTFYGGGVSILNCTMLNGGSASVAANVATLSTSIPNTVYNSVIVRSSTALSATTAGQIVEDYNFIVGTRTNVTAGANSTSDGSRCVMLDVGQSLLWGQTPRPLGTPTIGSPLLGFGNTAGSPAVDFLNRARPEGGNSLAKAVGYLERHDTAVQETTIVDSGGVGLRIDGPGSHEFLIPVDATATTISVKCQYDANHGAASPPQLVLQAAPELGVVSQTVTAPATVNQWATLTLATITPTTRGVVRVQLVARPSAASGKAYFDTFAIS